MLRPFMFRFPEFENNGADSCRFQISATFQKLSYMIWTILSCLIDLGAKIDHLPKLLDKG